jgi:hypothetical protein
VGVCVCVCVRERERERNRMNKGEIERDEEVGELAREGKRRG